MSFPYIVRPGNNSNRYQGQAQYRGTRTSEEHIAAVAAKTGLTPAQVAAVLRAHGEEVIDQGINGWRTEPVEGFIGYLFACGGSEDGPDFAPTYDNLNLALSGFLGDAGDARARAAFTAEKVGEQGRVVPVIVRVTDMVTRLSDHYSAGKSLQVELRNKNMDADPATATGNGVALRSLTTGALVKVTDYGLVKGNLIVCTLPAGLTGPQELSVTASLRTGTQRTGVYPTPLQP